ncbi:hypothetical protein GMLC_00770 [Geomonas limicola]|uniref:Zinc finger/thioredoxin putative domain-containing protein n=1 Tax=Geomonas limicola TaxID=2740186 RepID=A0A6V8N1X6_9BACT|nr:DUF3426 domain-containing protein [Geomonas limicola]GFO66498.1 hypothetical protein GMLC_00770 [Geomonas limicola]
MILQCDQCHTKFRLDDSKLKPGGVKVRCSKCRHVFLAGAEVKQEESEFDAILSGLGAPPVAAQSSEQVTPTPAPEPEGFGFEAALESAGAKEAPAVAAEPETPQATPTEEFAAFEFPSEPSDAAAQSDASTQDTDYSFGDFELPATSAAPETASPAATGLDYGELSFDDTPPSVQEAAAPQAGGELDFGEFSFSTEPEPQPAAEPAAPALDFGEFEFSSEPIESEPAPAAKAQELDFGEFSFDEATSAPAPEQAPAPKEEMDFGEFSFSDEPDQPQTVAPPAKEEFDFGDFSFDEEPARSTSISEPETASAPSTSTADQEPAPFSFNDAPQSGPAVSGSSASSDGFGDFTFTNEPLAPPAAETAIPAAAADLAAASVTGATVAPSEPRDVGTSSPFLFGAAAAKEKGTTPEEEFELGPLPTKISDDDFEDDGLPPLSIASRRKGRSVLAVSVVAISVLVIVVLSGAGLYLLQSGPAAFDKVGLGFVAKWFGMETPEEGRITIRNQQASFSQNKEAGELFVVTGEAVNSFRKARASIHVRVNIYDKKGTVLVQKTAYCGNRITPEQLSSLPMSKIESIMNNQFGDSLSNLGVQPGKGINFVVAIPNVPKDAADFGVEVIGSTVAGK